MFGEPFTSGFGMHNIHQNQGDPASSQWWDENGIWQDGGVLVLRPDGSLEAPHLPAIPTIASDIYTVGRMLAVLSLNVEGLSTLYRHRLPDRRTRRCWPGTSPTPGYCSARPIRSLAAVLLGRRDARAAAARARRGCVH